MATLYEINEKLLNFEFEIDEETGEILNAGELDNLELARDEKIENLCLYIKNLRADSEALKAEKEVFAQREKASKNKADRLASYLQAMLNGDTYKSLKAEVSYRKSESVECDDIALVPADFLRYKDPELNKTEVKKALKNGVDVRGCHLKTNINMQIK